MNGVPATRTAKELVFTYDCLACEFQSLKYRVNYNAAVKLHSQMEAFKSPAWSHCLCSFFFQQGVRRRTSSGIDALSVH